MPPVEVPTTRSKWSTIRSPVACSTSARKAAGITPFRPPPSIDKTRCVFSVSAFSSIVAFTSVRSRPSTQLSVRCTCSLSLTLSCDWLLSRDRIGSGAPVAHPAGADCGKGQRNHVSDRRMRDSLCSPFVVITMRAGAGRFNRTGLSVAYSPGAVRLRRYRARRRSPPTRVKRSSKLDLLRLLGRSRQRTRSSSAFSRSSVENLSFNYQNKPLPLRHTYLSLVAFCLIVRFLRNSASLSNTLQLFCSVYIL